MAQRPISNTDRARLNAAQQPGQAQVNVSYESDAVALLADESINVEGVSAVLIYGACNVLAHHLDGDTPVALEDATGAAVVVTTVRLVDVRGVRQLQCSAAVTVVYTG